jgi:hypothetical protein
VGKPTFTVTLTADQKQQLAAKGYTADTGTLPAVDGVTLSYVVNGLDVALTVEDKPTLMPVAVIKNRVNKMLTGG